MGVARTLVLVLPLAACLTKPSPPDDLACPATYQPVPSGPPTSRYRIGTADTDYTGAQIECEADAGPELGITYLVALDTRDEATALDAYLEVLPQGSPTRFWVGAEQDAGRMSPELGWHLLDGGMLPIGLWGGNEPDDADGVEDNDENVADLNPFAASGYLQDNQPFAAGRVALCECGPRTQ
jgi:hypothetical protein